MKKTMIMMMILTLAATWGLAVTVQVDPVSGTDDGNSPFLTIPAALTSIVGADANPDIVNLRTNGVHALSAQLVVDVDSADGDLTIQTDPGDTGSAIIRLPGAGAPQISLNADGDRTLLLSGLTVIGASGTGAVGGDGIQIFNSDTASGSATINITDCVFAANDGSDQPVPYDQQANPTTESFPGDDWIDYFEDTQGTMTNVKISEAGDEGLIIRGGGTNGANVTVTGDSVISFCGGRAVQSAFGGSGTPDIPVGNFEGSASERIRIFGNSHTSAEPVITCYNGNMSFKYVDVVDNNDLAFRVDTDTVDSFSMECCRVANNGLSAADPNQGGESIYFLWVTGDLLAATISKCTFHDSNKDVTIVCTADVTSTIDFTDCIFTGAGDQIDIAAASTAVVNFGTCALVSQNPDALGSPIFNDRAASSETGTINKSPWYVSTSFDYTDPQNPDFLRVTDRNSEYMTGSSTGGELTGGACLPVVNLPPPLAVSTPWNLYE